VDDADLSPLIRLPATWSESRSRGRSYHGHLRLDCAVVRSALALAPKPHAYQAVEASLGYRPLFEPGPHRA